MNFKVLTGIIGLICILYSCEDSESVSESHQNGELIGNWNRIDRIPSGRSESDFRYFNMESTYRFGTDDQFSYTVDFYGFEDENLDEIIGSSVRKVTFEIEGDSIFFRDLEVITWEEGFNPEPQTITLSGEKYGNKFTILNRTLTLSYISYPADAPVHTEMEYQRKD